MQNIIVDAAHVVLINGVRAGRIENHTFVQPDPRQFSAEFAKFVGTKIPTQTKTGGRALDERVAEALSA